jgi:cytochrome c553
MAKRTLLVWALALSACGLDAGDPQDDGSGHGFQIVSSLIYSAFDGVHDFTVPVVIGSGLGFVVDRWEFVDDKGVTHNDVAEFRKLQMLDGGMLKMQRAGDYLLLVHAGHQTGCAELHIAAGTAAQWSLGQTLFSDGLELAEEPASSNGELAAPAQACTQCHGTEPTSVASVPSPVRIAAYSDAELSRLLTMGVGPTPDAPRGTARCKPLPELTQSRATASDASPHHTAASADEIAALMLYLRSQPLNFHVGGCSGCHV